MHLIQQYFSKILIILSMHLQQIRKNQKAKNDYQKSYIAGKENNIGQYYKISSDYDQGDPLLTLGPNYVFFLTSFVIVNLISVTMIFKLKNEQRFKAFYFLSIVIMAYLDVVWLASALINPGIAPNTVITNGELCEQCMSKGREIMQADNRFHCQDCQICIDQQVMHFRLVGACIGKNNFIVFKLLLLGLFLWVLSMIVIIPQTLRLT